MRPCRPDEEPGVVVTRYANLAYGYDESVFVVPIRDHFTATRDTKLVPVLSSGGTLDAMQIDYWREHLRPYLHPLSQQRYEELKTELERFDMGRTIRRTLNMEILVGVLGPHKPKKYATEPIAWIDPVTQEMIPNGRWREAIGAAHMRTSIIITAPASVEQEARLIPFILAENREPFHALADNCSDFVERGMLKVFSDLGLQFRSRMSKVADAWITSPLEVATAFLNFAKAKNVPLDVSLVPMISGTRRPTVAITSISRGALVPNPGQGKMAFGMKIYFNTLNPLLGLTSYSVDQLSHFANLQRLVHERGGGELSKLAYQINHKTATRPDRDAWRREQIRVFGTASCWKQKQDGFATLVSQAKERGLLTQEERRLVLKLGQPYLLPRLYERAAAAQKHEGMLTVGMNNRVLTPPSILVSNFVSVDRARGEESPSALVSGRTEIRQMADSDDSEKRLLAFKLMVSVVNYDLSSEAVHRRLTGAFDQDWELLLDVSKKNDLNVPGTDLMTEPISVCSCREFDQGKAKQDVFGEGQGYWRWFARETREMVFGANR